MWAHQLEQAARYRMANKSGLDALEVELLATIENYVAMVACKVLKPEIVGLIREDLASGDPSRYARTLRFEAVSITTTLFSRPYWMAIDALNFFCRKGDGGKQSDDVEAALDRLKGTTIKNVRERPSPNGQRIMREVEAEGLISSYKVVSRTDNGKIAAVEIEAPQWLHREITEGKRPDVLTVHPDYFLIDPGIGRFVYRLARRAAGKGQAKWAFKTLYERSGSTGAFKKFSFTLRKLIEANDIPEYVLTEESGQMGPLLVMRHRDAPLLESPQSEQDDGAGGS